MSDILIANIGKYKNIFLALFQLFVIFHVNIAMLSKNKIKYIRSLEQKKQRKEEKAFLAEGSKLVGDLSGHFHCLLVAGTTQWIEKNPNFPTDEFIEVSHEELTRASLLKSPKDVLAVYEIPTYGFPKEAPKTDLCLALDDVQDPGNLGTIIRIADWFGIEHIFCSQGTVDTFNPKTVQATMGALARVKLHYCNLGELIDSLEDTPVYGTFLDGTDMYKEALSEKGLIVMGNEGNGISAEIARKINRKILIPNFPAGCETSESLNVAVATAIVCAEFRRRM